MFEIQPYVCSEVPLRGSADDLILYILAEFCEECTVSCYTNYEVLVLFRMLLSFDQSVVVDIVELHFAVSEVACCSEESDDTILTFLSIKETGHELEVVYHTDVHVII